MNLKFIDDDSFSFDGKKNVGKTDVGLGQQQLARRSDFETDTQEDDKSPMSQVERYKQAQEFKFIKDIKHNPKEGFKGAIDGCSSFSSLKDSLTVKFSSKYRDSIDIMSYEEAPTSIVCSDIQFLRMDISF